MKLIIKYPHPSLDLTFWLLLFHSMTCLLILLILSFAEQKFFYFNQNQFINYSFRAFDVVSKKSSPHPTSSRFSMYLLGVL